MERTLPVSAAKLRFWLVVSAAFLLWYMLISMYNSDSTPRQTSVSVVVAAGQANSVVLHNEGSVVIDRRNNVPVNENDVAFTPDTCSGRYIYVHHLPAKFNDDMLRECRSLSNWTDMCESTSNHGFGPPLRKAERVYTDDGWFATNQFALEVIFHNRMKRYECLTNDSSSASAVFVPFYAGLEVARFLWGRHNTTVRDSASLELVRWLREKPEWRKLHGRDHFLIAGRITWDFRRLSDEDSDWGNKLLVLPETENMTVLTIESSPWGGNDVAVPYPTYFHPLESAEVAAWQRRMRQRKRKFLFSFAGAPRPNMPGSIRGEIIEQCSASRGRCKLLKCDSGASKCHAPAVVMQMFQSSVFCLQPPGDSTTRRSAFDSILAGCVPVFFHPGSAYLQYRWHLPGDHRTYSVFIPESGVKNGTVSIGETLGGIPEERVAAMREEVVRLIPSVIYARRKLQGVEDAFDISVKAVLHRVEKLRKAMEEGSSSSLSTKLSRNRSDEHEWDHYYS